MTKIGLVQMAPVFGKSAANMAKIRSLIASAERCDVYVLPELANSGYRFRSRDELVMVAEEVNRSTFLNSLVGIAQVQNALIVSGFCERERDVFYNSAVLVGPDGLLGLYRKLHLFMDEKDFFEPGNLDLPVFDTHLGKIGMAVCYDWMFPEVWRSLALKGARLIAHPSNLVLPYCQRVTPSYALVNKCFIATANRTGSERDLTFTGQSVLTNPKGELILKGNEQEETVLVAKVQLDEADDKLVTTRNHAFNDRRTDVYGDFLK